MCRSRWLGRVLACASLTCWIVTASAYAQTAGSGNAPDSNATEYDGFISTALQAYDAGRFAEARSSFRRAHEIAPTARTLRTIGMCSFNLGDYVDALINLEAALSDTRKPLSTDQRSHASDLISRSQVHIGRFKIRLTPADAVIWADGRPPPQLLTGEILLEPGRHELLAQASGHQPSKSMLQVDGGDRSTLEIVLGASPAANEVGSAPAAKSSIVATSEAPSPVASTSSVAPSEHRPRTQAAIGYVALGLGGVSLVAFGVTTGLAASKESSLDTHCGNRECEPAYHDDVDTYDRYKLLSTVSLITGLVLVGTGVTLLLTQPDGSTEHAKSGQLTPMIGIGSIGLRGQL
jgi:hypothetical protein